MVNMICFHSLAVDDDDDDDCEYLFFIKSNQKQTTCMDMQCHSDCRLAVINGSLRMR